jgi:dTDP-4-amino-4,6-dideoxygalactose transaminase
LPPRPKENRDYYSHSEVGYNYRMNNISAGIGRGQLEVLEERIFKRRENHEFYKNIFKNIEEVNLLRNLRMVIFLIIG